jgi:hypothetical protein
MGLATEFAFTLPRGYLAPNGELHRQGIMRLATARDEIEPLRDPRVSGPDDPFLTLIVLSRVITQLGNLRVISPREIEGLFAIDLAFLQELYGVVNFGTPAEVQAFLREAEGVGQEEPQVNEDVAEERVQEMVVATFDGGDSFDDDEEDDDDDEGVIKPQTGPRMRRGAIVEEVARPN